MMRPRSLRLWLGAGVLALVSACAPTSRVTLLPQADGKPSAVQVSAEGQTQVLDQPYQTATAYRIGSLQAGSTSAEAVRARHGELIQLRPPAPQRYTLNFITGGTDLTPESAALLPEVLAAARARSGGEVLVVGHTDRVGSVEANDKLSLERARAVRELLIRQGFSPDLIEAIGRGEREPLVPTDDEVAEPRNRRVELVVR